MVEIKKEELEKLYREKTNIEVCNILGITKPTLSKILKANNILLKGKGKSKIKVI